LFCEEHRSVDVAVPAQQPQDSLQYESARASTLWCYPCKPSTAAQRSAARSSHSPAVWAVDPGWRPDRRSRTHSSRRTVSPELRSPTRSRHSRTGRRPCHTRLAFGQCTAAVTMARSRVVTSISRHPAPICAHHCGTGAGGDNGIAKMWSRRGISVSSHYDQSHYLHPHPYVDQARHQPARTSLALTTAQYFRCHPGGGAYRGREVLASLGLPLGERKIT
jgi:hypothetical protein